MRVSIPCNRCSVRRPTRMRDPSKACNMVTGNICCQLRHAICAARTPQPTVIVDRHPAGVIAAIFETLEPLDQNWGDIARSNGANDSAHRMSPKNISIVPTFNEYLFHKNINSEINDLI